MITEKEHAAIKYILDQIYPSQMLEELNSVGEYSYTIEEVYRCVAMIRNMCR